MFANNPASHSYGHRVNRVLGFFSSHTNWDPPPPVVPGERGWGSPNLDDGTDIVVLKVYMYFVAMALPIGKYCTTRKKISTTIIKDFLASSFIFHHLRQKIPFTVRYFRTKVVLIIYVRVCRPYLNNLKGGRETVHVQNSTMYWEYKYLLSCSQRVADRAEYEKNLT